LSAVASEICPAIPLSEFCGCAPRYSEGFPDYRSKPHQRKTRRGAGSVWSCRRLRCNDACLRCLFVPRAKQHADGHPPTFGVGSMEFNEQEWMCQWRSKPADNWRRSVGEAIGEGWSAVETNQGFGAAWPRTMRQGGVSEGARRATGDTPPCRAPASGELAADRPRGLRGDDKPVRNAVKRARQEERARHRPNPQS
jgi:hypothetical protein